MAEVSSDLFRREPRDIFLNVDDCMTEWKWTTPDMLIVNAQLDGSDYEKVRRFLEPYSDLIVKLGGDVVNHMEPPVVEESEPEEILRLLRSSFDDKRRNRVDIDVIFVDAQGQEYPAHRIYLAACAPHFNSWFYTSGMIESTASVEHPAYVRLPPECVDGRCIEYILGWFLSSSSL